MKLNMDLRKQCDFFGFTDNHENESILIFHSCSTNLDIKAYFDGCEECHIGNTPRSIMTKGTSTRRKNGLPGSLYGNFDPGNNDKLMITYRREPSHDYEMYGACGVMFEGEIHFFGGEGGFEQQHFVIETQRSGQLVKMREQEDLEIGFQRPSCSSFEMTGEYFPWFRTNVVILCFDFLTYEHEKSCYLFDSELTFIAFSTYEHLQGGLTSYNGNLLTVGSWNNQKTEILKIDENKNFSWSVVEQEFKFNHGDSIYGHSLVTVESSDINKEYVLLIGGDTHKQGLDNIFKFNGTWFPFGQLNKPRTNHNSIYWNGAIYVIGGANYGDNVDVRNAYGRKTKMEIWNIKDSPEQFKAEENWPELLEWEHPHLFIISDSFFPDH